MPPKFKFTKEEIIASALEITRDAGIEALTARSLAAKLGASSKPIFGLFKNMDEVQSAVITAADTVYQSYITKETERAEYPPYKASGMAYIRFAGEEKELFKLLFMRDRSRESIKENREVIRPQLEIIMKTLNMTEDEAFKFHLEMWCFVHGIATMVATDYLNWDTSFISDALTDAFLGLKQRYTGGK